MIRILAAFWLSFAVAVPGAQGSSLIEMFSRRISPKMFAIMDIPALTREILEALNGLDRSFTDSYRDKIDELKTNLSEKFAFSKRADPLWYIIARSYLCAIALRLGEKEDSLSLLEGALDACLQRSTAVLFAPIRKTELVSDAPIRDGVTLAEYVQKPVGQTGARSDVKNCHKMPMAILSYQAAKKERIEVLVQQFSNNPNLINGQLVYAYEPLRPDSSDARISSTTQPLKHLVAMASVLDCAVVHKIKFSSDDELAKEIASTILTGGKFGIDYDRSATQDEFDIFYYSISQAVHYFDFNGLTEHFLGSGYSGLSNGKQKEHRANVFLCAAMAWSHNQMPSSGFFDVIGGIAGALDQQKEDTMFQIAELHHYYKLGYVADKYIQPEERK